MHELALCENIVQTLRRSAEIEGFSQVTRIWLEVGSLAAVDMRALRFNFDLVARGTVAEAAMIEINEIPAHAWCMNCSRTVEVYERFARCSFCGNPDLSLAGGAELKIMRLEVK